MVDVLNAVKMPLEPSIGEFHHPVPLAIAPLQASISYGHPGGHAGWSQLTMQCIQSQ